MKKNIVKIIALLLVFSVFASGTPNVQAAKKAKVSTKKLTIKTGSSKKISVLNKKKGAKYTFKASKKKIVSISKKGVVKALKKGTVKITVKETYKKKTRKIGIVTVTCKQANSSDGSLPPAASLPAASMQPPAQTSTPPSPSQNVAQTPSPEATESPEPPLELKTIVPDLPDGFDKKQDGITYGSVQRIEYYSTTTEKMRKANIILPANYTESKQYPVLYLLHGIGGDQNEWLKGATPEIIVGNLTAKEQAKEMIIVIPNCRARANDSATTEFTLEHYAAFDNFINDLRDNLMPYVKDHYSIATGRKNTAIAGLSMGGRESLNIGLNMTDTFDYIGAFSPGYGVFAYSANGVSEPGLFTEETFRLPDEYKNNTLLMINNGISEGGENAIGGTCHKVLEKNEIPHIFYVTEGGHDFQVWKHGLYNFALQIFQ